MTSNALAQLFAPALVALPPDLAAALNRVPRAGQLWWELGDRYPILLLSHPDGRLRNVCLYGYRRPAQQGSWRANTEDYLKIRGCPIPPARVDHPDIRPRLTWFLTQPDCTDWMRPQVEAWLAANPEPGS